MDNNEYTFSDTEAALLMEYDLALRDIQAQLQGALRMVAITRGLSGQWERRGNKLVRDEKQKPS